MTDEQSTDVGGIAADRLRSLIERIERLEEEKKAIASDIRDIYAEAKGAGFDTKIMKTIIKLRKMNAADRDEQDMLLDTYRRAFFLITQIRFRLQPPYKYKLSGATSKS